jgi:hypothetical protein
MPCTYHIQTNVATLFLIIPNRWHIHINKPRGDPLRIEICIYNLVRLVDCVTRNKSTIHSINSRPALCFENDTKTCNILLKWLSVATFTYRWFIVCILVLINQSNNISFYIKVCSTLSQFLNVIDVFDVHVALHQGMFDSLTILMYIIVSYKVIHVSRCLWCTCSCTSRHARLCHDLK